MQAIDFAGVQCGDNVRVLQSAERFHFPLEARYLRFTGQLAVSQNLDGHGLLQRAVNGPIDRAHAPFAELLEEFVVAEAMTGVNGPSRFFAPGIE